MCRGDIFFITLSQHLYCVDCWEKVPGVQASAHRETVEEVEALAKRRAAEMQEGFPAFTRQNWDDMFEHTRDAFRQRAADEIEQPVWDGEFPA